MWRTCYAAEAADELCTARTQEGLLMTATMGVGAAASALNPEAAGSKKSRKNRTGSGRLKSRRVLQTMVLFHTPRKERQAKREGEREN